MFDRTFLVDKVLPLPFICHYFMIATAATLLFPNLFYTGKHVQDLYRAAKNQFGYIVYKGFYQLFSSRK